MNTPHCGQSINQTTNRPISTKQSIKQQLVGIPTSKPLVVKPLPSIAGSTYNLGLQSMHKICSQLSFKGQTNPWNPTLKATLATHSDASAAKVSQSGTPCRPFAGRTAPRKACDPQHPISERCSSNGSQMFPGPFKEPLIDKMFQDSNCCLPGMRQHLYCAHVCPLQIHAIGRAGVDSA